MRKLRLTAVLVLVSSALAACSATDPFDDAPIVFDGVVTFSEFGGWVIKATDGTQYEPINLAAEYEEEGLRVRAGVEVAEGYGSRIMVGPVVRILEIERRR